MTQPTTDPNAVALVVGGQMLLGWQEIRITRGCELVPAHFDFQVTERNPTNDGGIFVEPGAPCQVMIGGDLVITGYVDRYRAELGPEEHSIHVCGRSKSQDLVDCSAILDQMTVQGDDAVSLAIKLAIPYGIGVEQISGGRPMIPQFNVSLGETPWDIIERIARYSALLAYDDTDGNLILAQAGTEQHASGFVQGINVESADVSFSMDERFQTYVAALMSTAYASDIGGGTGNFVGMATDKGVTRDRKKIIVSEQVTLDGYLAVQRARWEMARRAGRSQQINLTCDSWRDSAGMLWTPNTLALVHCPLLKLDMQNWLIGEVTYEKGEAGTHAHVKLMPREAFLPEPEVLQPFEAQIAVALGGAQQQGIGPAPSAIGLPGSFHQ